MRLPSRSDAVHDEPPGADALVVEVFADQAGVRGGDPLAVEVGDRPVSAAGGGKPEPGAAEAEGQHLLGLCGRVDQHVAAGDAQIEGALPHVHGDVAGTQVVELNAVVGIDQHQILGIMTLPVASLAQHPDGRFGEGALIGHGDL